MKMNPKPDQTQAEPRLDQNLYSSGGCKERDSYQHLIDLHAWTVLETTARCINHTRLAAGVGPGGNGTMVDIQGIEAGAADRIDCKLWG